MKYNWDFSIFEKVDYKEYRESLTKSTTAFIKKWSKNRTYLEDAKDLKVALDEYNSWLEEFKWGGMEGIYLFLQSALKEDDTKIKSERNKFNDYFNKLISDFSFFTISLSKASIEKQKEFLADSSLKKYHYFLESLFENGKHTLSEAEERIIIFKSKTSYENWVDMVSEFLSKEEAEVLNRDGKKQKLPLAEIIALMDSTNKKVRDSVGKKFLEINTKWAEVAEHEINSILEDKKNEDYLRNFKRPEEATMLSDRISIDTVDTLVDAVASYNSISNDFYKLKAKLLGLKKLAYYERNIPVELPEMNFSLDEGIEIVGNVFKKLDSRFYEIYMQMINDGRVDFKPVKGKSNGAFCIASFTSGPIHILMNYTGKLQDVLTLAHEFGHAINYHLSKEQPGIYYDSSIATAEVASTFFEDFALEEVKNTVDDKARLGIIMYKLNDEVSSIFRQIACYRFEQDLHNNFREKGYLSKDEIGNFYLKNMKAYMGDSINYDSGAENTWVYWSHIRRYFYVYSYASGQLISKSLQAAVRKDKKFIEKVKDFLRAGESESPSNIFTKLGVNIDSKSFWQGGLESIKADLQEAERLSEKLGKSASKA